jgi:uncharacterized OsmC-like protein
MSVTIEGLYLGNKKVRLLHEPSGVELITDAPRDNFGEGASFSPTDLMAGAVGACMMTIMGILAERSGIDLSGMRMRVEKHMQSEPRRIRSLSLVLRLPQRLAPEQRQKLEQAAQGCPALHSLHPEVSVEVRYVYDV